MQEHEDGEGLQQILWTCTKVGHELQLLERKCAGAGQGRQSQVKSRRTPSNSAAATSKAPCTRLPRIETFFKFNCHSADYLGTRKVTVEPQIRTSNQERISRR